MPEQTPSPEQPHKDIYANEIVVDQCAARRLEELCSQMTDTYGLIEATLQLAVKDVSNKREAYIKAALNLSARGTRAIKMFLCEWCVLVEESKSRENSGRSSKDSTGEPKLALSHSQLPLRQFYVSGKIRP